jgi:hypothetical protein
MLGLFAYLTKMAMTKVTMGIRFRKTTEYAALVICRP